ncbi:Trk system potassium transport protein TrkA [bacterium F16]|nr:Trk system potassium transport protein TrkA [bacterium F16]
MKTIILGAGELGKNLAAILAEDHHDVVVVDINQALLQRLQDRADVMVIHGNCASVKVLKDAGIDTADILVAATCDEAANILACKTASHYNVRRTFCRLHSSDFFDNEDGLTPKSFGITDVIVPEDDCVERIINVLKNSMVVERITFSLPEAVLLAVRISESGTIAGIGVRDIPHTDLLRKIRFAGLVRSGTLLVPDGDTVFRVGDEVYLSGMNEDVERALKIFEPKASPIKSVIIGDATRLGGKLAARLEAMGKHVKVIANDRQLGKSLLEKEGLKALVLHGDPTENDILREAGVDTCDAYVSTMKDDEDNILSSILAKKMGAGKVVAITNKAEYIDVVPDMRMIDCGFNSGLVAVNTVLRAIGGGRITEGIEAALHRCHAYVYEFIVEDGAPVANMQIQAISNPHRAIFAMVFRQGKVLNAAGDLELQVGDIVAIMATPEKAEKISALFHSKKGFFS